MGIMNLKHFILIFEFIHLHQFLRDQTLRGLWYVTRLDARRLDVPYCLSSSFSLLKCHIGKIVGALPMGGDSSLGFPLAFPSEFLTPPSRTDKGQTAAVVNKKLSSQSNNVFGWSSRYSITHNIYLDMRNRNKHMWNGTLCDANCSVGVFLHSVSMETTKKSSILRQL